MKSKALFWILAILVFGTILFAGFQFRKTDVTTFFIVETIGILAAVLFWVLYRRLIKPYQIISDGMELLREQDFSSRLRSTSSKEANKLIEIFNKMMDQLKDERVRMREKNHFLDLLIEASPQGLIILDFDERITDINPAGLRLLNLKDLATVAGKTLAQSDVLLLRSLAKLKPAEDIVLRTSGINLYRCVRSSFIDRGFVHPFILIEELTRELLEIERNSYESIIRMMAHEVNNSVGAVCSTLNVIADTLRSNEDNELIDVLPAVDASFDRCRHLGAFISNFAEVVKIPEPTTSKISINELALGVKEFARIECEKRNIKLSLTLTHEECFAQLDYIQMEQVLINIVKNAYEAIGEGGEIRICTEGSPLSISIADNGLGISEDIQSKLFTPFFTTKNTGQGVGLMFVREVLVNHKYKFDFATEDGWTEFKIYFSE